MNSHFNKLGDKISDKELADLKDMCLNDPLIKDSEAAKFMLRVVAQVEEEKEQARLAFSKIFTHKTVIKSPTMTTEILHLTPEARKRITLPKKTWDRAFKAWGLEPDKKWWQFWK